MHSQALLDRVVERPVQIRQYRKTQAGHHLGLDGNPWHRNERYQLEYHRQNLHAQEKCLSTDTQAPTAKGS